MSKQYFNLTIPLVAGVAKTVKVANGSSFVMNTGTGTINCKVNGKSFRLRESQVQNHEEDIFQEIELETATAQTVDIRFGTGGMIVSPPQKEFVNLAGDLNTSLDAGDMTTLAQEIANRMRSSSNIEYDDVTIASGASAVLLIAADTTARQTMIQRIDANEVRCRVGAAPTATKGIEMRMDDTMVFSGGGSVSVFNNSGSDVTFAISREII